MQEQTFNASAGFHLANAGTDRNVELAEQICALEKDRIRMRNEPERIRLQWVLATLSQERQQLQAIIGAALSSRPYIRRQAERRSAPAVLHPRVPVCTR